ASGRAGRLLHVRDRRTEPFRLALALEGPRGADIETGTHAGRPGLARLSREHQGPHRHPDDPHPHPDILLPPLLNDGSAGDEIRKSLGKVRVYFASPRPNRASLDEGEYSSSHSTIFYPLKTLIFRWAV